MNRMSIGFLFESEQPVARANTPYSMLSKSHEYNSLILKT